ncbi:BF3164 family lipoprotein [Parabacteroides sp. APC149_11_2_Y6]
MKNLTYTLLLLLLSTMLACTSSNKYQHSISINKNSFPIKQALYGSNIEFDSILMKPFQLQVYDTLLITYNQNTDKLFHIFNLKSKKKIGERISMGQGPTEMIMPWFIQNQDVISIFDMGTSTISKYTISEFITNPDPIPYQQIKIKEQFFGEIGFLGENIIGSLYRPEYPLYLFNNAGEQIKGFGSYPISNFNYTNAEIIDAYRSIIITNQVDRVAICHFFTDLIDIYDNNGTLISRIHGPEHFFPKFKEYTDGNVITTRPVNKTYKDAFYSPVNVGDDFFVLYNGKNVGEKDYNLLAEKIFVFDWEGTPKKIFSLDQGISRISVDKRNKKIYGISNEPEYHIVEYSYK